MIISLQRYTIFSIYANIFGRKLQIFVNFRPFYGKSNMSKVTSQNKLLPAIG